MLRAWILGFASEHKNEPYRGDASIFLFVCPCYAILRYTILFVPRHLTYSRRRTRIARVHKTQTDALALNVCAYVCSVSPYIICAIHIRAYIFIELARIFVPTALLAARQHAGAHRRVDFFGV